MTKTKKKGNSGNKNPWAVAKTKYRLNAKQIAMAKELGMFYINVNTIAPGFTHSAGGDSFDQNKTLLDLPLEDLQINVRTLKRRPVPEDQVGLAIFLATDDSRNITGQLIVNDCGLNFH